MTFAEFNKLWSNPNVVGLPKIPHVWQNSTFLDVAEQISINISG